MTEVASCRGVQPQVSPQARDHGHRGAASLLVAVLSLVVMPLWRGPRSRPCPGAINLPDALTPPAWADGGVHAHLLGTDNLGRDILSRIIDGRACR